MIEETARVVAREGEDIWFEVARQSACGQCAARSGCGTGALGKVVGRKTVRMKTHNTVDASVGDRVIVGFHEDALVRGSMAVYLVPLLTLMLGGILGEAVAPQLNLSSVDAVSAMMGAAGLVAGFFWVRRFGRGAARDDRYQPVMLKRLPAAEVTVELKRAENGTTGYRLGKR